MTLQQLEYILAVDECRHFAKAAQSCHVTQPTLSTMIQKLEEELGIRIFDRSKKPVIPTEEGKAIIAQARRVIGEARRLRDLSAELQGELTGRLELGIIPTVAPYLLPAFLPRFLEKYPGIQLHVTELTTDEIVHRLKHHQLDAAILATPLHERTLQEYPLYYEEFVVYASPRQEVLEKRFVLPQDIRPDQLWLLEEGHCLRMQVINLCELHRPDAGTERLSYAAGSIQTLKKIVDMGHGLTILPELALADLSEEEHQRLRFFKPPAPVREISLVSWRYFARERLLDAVRTAVRASVPPALLQRPHARRLELVPEK